MPSSGSRSPRRRPPLRSRPAPPRRAVAGSVFSAGALPELRIAPAPDDCRSRLVVRGLRSRAEIDGRPARPRAGRRGRRASARRRRPGLGPEIDVVLLDRRSSSGAEFSRTSFLRLRIRIWPVIRMDTAFSCLCCLPGRQIGLNGPILDFLEKRVLFVTGKGGVGKSTVAIALGIRAALEGKRAIVVEVSLSTENASRIFRQADVGFKEVEMANDSGRFRSTRKIPCGNTCCSS